MKYPLFVCILVLLMFAAQVNAITVTNSSDIVVNWVKGQTQQPMTIRTFTNPDNYSVNLTIAKYGADLALFDFLPQSPITINPLSSTNITIIYNIQQTTPPGVYTPFITGNFGPNPVIPIKINVSDPPAIVNNTTDVLANECFILAPQTTDTISIIKGASPITVEYSGFRLSSGCTNGMEVSLRLEGIIQTTKGIQPVRIKSSSLGNPKLLIGDKAGFVLEYDASANEITSKAYPIKAIMSGIYGDRNVKTEISISVNVQAPDMPFSAAYNYTEPKYTVPTQVQVGLPFTIKILTDNSNIQVSPVNIPEDLVPLGLPNQTSGGLGVEQAYMINKTGKYDITFQARDKINNWPLSQKKFTIEAIGAIVAQQSAFMKFNFVPPQEELRDGNTVAIETRDNITNNYIASTILVNGVELHSTIVNGVEIKNNTFTVEAGKKYILTAINPKYNTLDYNFTVPYNKLTILVDNTNPQVLDYITVMTKDEQTNEIIPASITVDDQPMGQTTSIQIKTEGNHTITADYQGYLPASIEVYSESIPQLTYAPQALELNTTSTFMFNKNTTYSLVYKELPNSTPQTILNGDGPQVIFSPARAGIYSLYIKDAKMREYYIEQKVQQVQQSSFTFDWKLIPIGVVVVGVVLLLGSQLFGKKKKRKAGYGDPNVVSEM